MTASPILQLQFLIYSNEKQINGHVPFPLPFSSSCKQKQTRGHTVCQRFELLFNMLIFVIFLIAGQEQMQTNFEKKTF